MSVTDPSNNGKITATDLQRVFQQMWYWQPPSVLPYMVSAPESDWIKDPTGEPPTTHAVMVAMEVGTVQAGHPAFDAVMATFRGQPAEGRP